VLNFEPFIYFGGEVANAVGLYRDLTNGASPAQIDEFAVKSLDFMKNRVAMLASPN